MLGTVMDVPGDSFEERWSRLEERVRNHCDEFDAPYPETTLTTVRPWFETIGEWFDWAAPAMREFVAMPADEDPALRVLREADQLLSIYADVRTDDRHGFPGDYYYLVSTIRWANNRLLYVVQNGPRDADRYADAYSVPFHNRAVFALAEYVHRTGHVVHPRRWKDVKPKLKKRAKRHGQNFDHVLAEGLKRAVLMAISDIREDVQIEAGPDVHPRAVSSAKRRQAGRILMYNLTPGVEASDLRTPINNHLTEDALGPNWRRSDESWDELEAETRESARIQISQAFTRVHQAVERLYVEELLTCDALSDSERQAVRLRYKDGLSNEEIAEEMEISPSTVGTHLWRAREKLPKPAS